MYGMTQVLPCFSNKTLFTITPFGKPEGYTVHNAVALDMVYG
jgi:hypothetical protein